VHSAVKWILRSIWVFDLMMSLLVPLTGTTLYHPVTRDAFTAADYPMQILQMLFFLGLHCFQEPYW